MYHPHDFPKCPHCKEYLEVTKVIDTEHCGDEVVLIVQGYCPECDKKFSWEEIFSFHSARKIVEFD